MADRLSRGFKPDPILPDIRNAWLQLKAERGGPLGWLCEWVRTKPTDWVPGARETAGYKLLALIYGPLPDNLLLLGREPIPPVPAADVDRMHGELGHFLSQLVSGPVGHKVPVPTDGLTEVLVRVTEPGNKPAHFLVSEGGPRRTILYQRIKQMILADGDDSRLIVCPECQKPMVAWHKRRFCSNTCNQAWHDDRRERKTGRRATKKGAAS